MERMLLIVDPQVDFINGSLPVPGAEPAMEQLADYILLSDGRYSLKIITADRHPFDHCSFSDCGGQWPRHCVHDTVGAAIWPSVFEAVYSTGGRAEVMHKGESTETDQYSVFQGPEAVERIRALTVQHAITAIDICGLAGDVCVLNTLRDAISLLPDISLRVLRRFSPSLDGGAILDRFIAEHNLQHD